MKRAFFFGVLLFGLSLGLHQLPGSQASFTDVDAQHPHQTAILYLQSEGMIQGYADGSFVPDGTINRAEFMKIIVESLLGDEPSAPEQDCFPDVPKDQWFAPYVCYAQASDIVGGYPDGSFRPTQTIQFVEAAKIMSRSWADIQEDGDVWYQTFVEYLGDAGAIPLQIMSLQQSLTRGQMAEMIYRLHARISDLPSQSYEQLSGVGHILSHLESQSVMPTGTYGNEVSITEQGIYRYITSNGLPNHETGAFPNPGNPNQIQTQSHQYRVTLNPIRQITVTELDLGVFGVAVNGVPFDPGAAEFWNNDQQSGWQYDALGGGINLGLDFNHAHVQPDGTYHYHGLPSGLLGEMDDDHHSPLIGYAADGFPIYALYGLSDPADPDSKIIEMESSYQLKAGTRKGGPGGEYDGTFNQDFDYVDGSGTLDECNGRFAITPEYPEGIYQYYITDSYPFVPRCIWGEADASFRKTGGGGPAAGGTGAAQGPPEAALDACDGKSLGASCSFSDRGNSLSGLCQNTPGGFACVPSGGPR